MLNSCTTDELTPGEIYLLRLGDALPAATSELAIDEQNGPPAFPQRRELLIDIPRQDISVVEFANLHRCDMGGLIGARNSGLGRLAGDVERLRYELKWLAAARRCAASGQTWLVEHITHKSRHLPANLWNATLASSQFNTAMGTTGDASSSDVAALQKLADIVVNVLQPGPHELDMLDETVTELATTLRNVSLQISVGQRLQSWQHTVAILEAAGAAIVARQAGVCSSGQATPRMRRLARVFQVYYVARWQASFGPRLTRDRQWVEALHKTAQLYSDVATPAFSDWFEATVAVHNSSSLWRRLQSAVQSHARAWQHLIESCGMQVTDLRETQ